MGIVKTERQWFDIHSYTLRASLEDLYVGPETNWTAVSDGLRTVQKVVDLFNGSVPESVITFACANDGNKLPLQEAAEELEVLLAEIEPRLRFYSKQFDGYDMLEMEMDSERVIESADISQFKQVEQGNVSTAVERVIRMNWIGNILLWGTLLAFGNPIFWLLPIVGVILKVVARTSGRIELDYSFDAEKEEEHLRRMDAWQLLVEGDKEWQILTEQQNANVRNNAGASRSLKRAECKIAKGHPFYIKTNVDTIQIILHNKESLIILPDKVLFVRKRKVGAIDYADFIINVSSTRFVESDPVPKDAQIVGQTWQYVNKNGTPDRRHKDNKQFPVCMYGQITLRSASGLNVELHISNLQNALDFAELIK